MATGKSHLLKIIKWANSIKNMHNYFRWNWWTTHMSFIKQTFKTRLPTFTWSISITQSIALPWTSLLISSMQRSGYSLSLRVVYAHLVEHEVICTCFNSRHISCSLSLSLSLDFQLRCISKLPKYFDPNSVGCFHVSTLFLTEKRGTHSFITYYK